MNNPNPRIARLKQMMVLEEKRMALQDELDSLLKQLSALKDHLFDEGASAPAPAAKPAKAPKPAKTGRPGRPRGAKRNPRGLLKDKIMAALEVAGTGGVKVKELAIAIGTKPVNIHSWFHSALKRNEPIKKITGGHYRLDGKTASASEKASSKPAAAAKSPAAAKPAKPSASAAKSKGRGGTKRGQLTAQIMDALKAAGSGGSTVADIATKLGAKYKNIYIWFATTGKKQPDVKKLGPAKYKLG